MKRITIILSIIVTSLYGLAQSPVEDPDDPHWVQTWGDEFSGTSLNTTLWSPIYGWGSCSDQSALTEDGSNHLFQDGMVKLMTYEQNEDCYKWVSETTRVYYPKPYTSGHMVSKNAFKYGYFEIRSRFPMNGHYNSSGGFIIMEPPLIPNGPVFLTGEGFSPTFWLFPCYKNPFTGYIKYSEIDMYEICGRTNQYTCNIHYADADHYTLMNNVYHPYWTFHTQWLYDDYVFTINDGAFHTYAMKWDSLSIRFYYDGNQICHYYHNNQNNDVFIPCNLLPMNIIVGNSAFADNFGDSITSNTIMPYAYDIDYVRVFNLECDKETVVGDIPDFRHYYCAVKKSISMGSLTIFPAGTTTYLHATDFIEMLPGFEVSGTSQVKMIIDSPCLDESTFNYPW